MSPEFHFLRPEWFWALPALTIIAWVWWRQRLHRGNWIKVCDQALLPYIMEDQPGRSSRLPWSLFILGSLIAVTALAGPTWERLPLPVYRNESALVIVLDLSRTMDAQDTKPSRLKRSRFKVLDLLQQRKDGLTAVVVYSNDAYTVTPLTEDNATITSQLPALETSIMPEQGSDTSTALRKAGLLFKNSGHQYGNILLIADSVDRNAAKVAEELRQQGYRLFVLGVGSEQGAPVPSPRGGFIKDEQGNIVIARLDSPGLNSLARAGGGFYRQLTIDDRDIRAFLAEFENSTKLPQEETEMLETDQWVDQGRWLLLFILPIAMLAFRRGYLVVLTGLVLPISEPVHAWQWSELWQTPDQQAYQAFRDGDPGRAAELFRDPAWKAASQYSAGDYTKAIETLNQTDTKETAYNKGNALARAGRFPEALQAFNQALEQDPEDQDARFNRDLIEKLMREQEQSENQSSDQKNKQDSEQNQENAGQNGDEENDPQSSREESPDPGSENQESKSADESDAGQPDSASRDQQKGDQNEPNPAQSEDDPQDAGSPNHATAEERAAQQQKQADEQWLRTIPDDPAGLLRRKFKYQYKKRNPKPIARPGLW